MSDNNGTALAPVDGRAEALEAVIIKGDLAKLTAAERVAYYRATCESTGLNPMTRPFDYITLNGKLTLYALRGAADQLRKLHGISIAEPAIEFRDGLCWVTVTGTDRDGRTDTEIGAVPMPNGGEAAANAVMKALTKAKRRLTLSMAGLGWLDETEVTTIPSARPALVDHGTGEIVDAEPATPARTNGKAPTRVTCEQAADACNAVMMCDDLAKARELLAAARRACLEAKRGGAKRADIDRLRDEFFAPAEEHVAALEDAASEHAIDAALESDDDLDGDGAPSDREG